MQRYEEKKTLLLLPLAGALLGYFCLHPISMLIMMNRIEFAMILESFSPRHFTMSLYYILIGLFGGVSVALLQVRIMHQRTILHEQNILLEQSNAEKETLLRILSHDLTNYIISSRDLLQMMVEDPKSFSNSESLEIIQGIAGGLSEASNLIDVSRNLIAVESGKVELELSEYDIGKLTKEIGATYALKSEKKGLSVRFDISDQPAISMVEPTIFKHTIIGNLLNNAIKFSDEGQTIWIKIKKDMGNNEIIISNNGPGIAVDKLKSIFSVSGKTTTLGTAGEKGTGLGLPLVYKFVGLMKGTISVESKPSVKQKAEYMTTFTITLPAVRV